MNPNTIESLLHSPWALKESHAGIVASALLGLSAEVTAAKKPKASARSGDTAIIPIYGVLTDRDSFLSELFGATTYESLGRMFDAAMEDAKTQTIVLDIDSPGGVVFGLDEIASKVNAGSKQKRVIGVANTLAASAAYYIGCQANEFVVSPSSESGCIGTIYVHPDFSKAYEAMGIKLTVLKSDEKKGAGSPYEPLDEVGRAEIMSEISDYHDQFVRAVARGRSVSMARVREDFGKGGVFRAEAAVKAGVADRIGTLESVLAKYGSTPETATRYSADFLRRRLMLRKHRSLVH